MSWFASDGSLSRTEETNQILLRESKLCVFRATISPPDSYY
jgi:hypothetical protein